MMDTGAVSNAHLNPFRQVIDGTIAALSDTPILFEQLRRLK